MAGNADWSEIMSTTLHNYSSKMFDNVTDKNEFLRQMKKRDRLQTLSGGTSIVRGLDYTENVNSGWFSGTDTLPIAATSTTTSAEYAWTSHNTSVLIVGDEFAQNRGKEERFDLVKTKLTNAMRTSANQINTALFSDGTGDSGKQLDGLAKLVADAPATGIVGGINRATAGNEFWRNATGTGNNISATTIQPLMNTLWLDIIDGAGGETPDIIFAGRYMYDVYQASLTPLQRSTNTVKLDGGAASVTFSGSGGTAPVFYDPACDTNHMYMLNTDFLKFSVMKGFMMTPGVVKQVPDQDVTVQNVIFRGNLTMSNAQAQGVLYNVVV